MTALYNKVLDSCAELRDRLGAVSDNIALGTALETLWADAREFTPSDEAALDNDENGAPTDSLRT